MKIKKYTFDLQGHRGARGIIPENTMEGFQQAIDFNVNTLELDVVISKDSLVVVSHEAYMNPKICLDQEGEPIKDISDYNLYNLTYDEIKTFDCGSLKNPDFPEQKNTKSYKPLLTDVIKLTSENFKKKGYRVFLNIELKSSPETDNVYHPEPKAFVDLVMKAIQSGTIPFYKITIQSFDKRIVRYTNKTYPMVRSAYVVESGTFYDNIQDLGVVPNFYMPYYEIIDSLQIKQAKDSGVGVIPWTVNDVLDMQKLLEIGVDGIITDYPNRAKPFHIRKNQ